MKPKSKTGDETSGSNSLKNSTSRMLSSRGALLSNLSSSFLGTKSSLDTQSNLDSTTNIPGGRTRPATGKKKSSSKLAKAKKTIAVVNSLAPPERYGGIDF